MDASAETTEIWGQMHDRLLDFIRRAVPTIQDAEDILQDVFVRIHANLDRLKDAQSLTAWIYRIARNAITDYYRERAKTTEAMKTLAEEVDETAAVSVDPAPDPDECCGPGEAIAAATRFMVDRLPEPYREAVTLTELEGLTQVEAAGKLGISVSGMKSRVQRGREKLKERLLDCCRVEFDRHSGDIDMEPRESCDCDSGDCP